MRDLCELPSCGSADPKCETGVFAVVTILFHSTNVALDDNNMGPCLGDNAVWSGSAADGCACGGYKQRKCQNNPRTSKRRGSEILRK